MTPFEKASCAGNPQDENEQFVWDTAANVAMKGLIDWQLRENSCHYESAAHEAYNFADALLLKRRKRLERE